MPGNVGQAVKKWCRDCGRIKPATEFWRRKQSPDGLALYCKECFGERNADAYRGRISREGKTARPYRRRSGVPAGMKYCPSCGEVKSVAAFGQNRAKKSGLTAYCRPCHNQVAADNKRRNHDSQRNYLLKLRYGLTEVEVRCRIQQQGDICVICLRKSPEHVDHNHETGLFRGMLCFSCNGGLGQFEDYPYRLRRAAAYLEGELSHSRLMELEFGEPMLDASPLGHIDRLRRARSNQRAEPPQFRRGGRYGVSNDDLQRISTLQRDLCPICCEKRGEHADHCHWTGVVRGVLCSGCNSGMGQFKDDPNTLRRAADYVDEVLLRQVEADGRTRLSFTIPDVDPRSVPAAGWGPYRIADGRERKALLDMSERLERFSWLRLVVDETYPHHVAPSR